MTGPVLIEEYGMIQPIRAIYEDGQLKLLDPVELQNGDTVEITIVSKSQETHQPRVLGLHRGAITTTDDFDDALFDILE
jgi:predicted DNA-binding antitoxin AbrB/MazE fold protein